MTISIFSTFSMVFADTTTTIAWVILLVAVLGWIVYGLANLRSGKREIGSEIKLAANRKPYYDDERLEVLGKLIGEEAHIRVEALDPEKSNSVRVTDVWPVVMPVPARWADEVGELE